MLRVITKKARQGKTDAQEVASMSYTRTSENGLCRRGDKRNNGDQKWGREIEEQKFRNNGGDVRNTLADGHRVPTEEFQMNHSENRNEEQRRKVAVKVDLTAFREYRKKTRNASSVILVLQAKTAYVKRKKRKTQS
jgi:hypothetical protein